MKLTNKAIGKFKKSTCLRLGLALGFTERWITQVVKDNKPNGPLTTAAALKVIREETGLKDSQILEESELIGQQS